jgi:hypothetical protein
MLNILATQKFMATHIHIFLSTKQDHNKIIWKENIFREQTATQKPNQINSQINHETNSNSISHS